MSNILSLSTKAPRCPLCHEWMEKMLSPARGIFLWVCHGPGCKVAIAVNDPFVGKWDQALASVGTNDLNLNDRGKIPCPVCDSAMRAFFTSTGYVKAVCVKKGCGAVLESAQPDRAKTDVVMGKGLDGAPKVIEGIDRPVSTPDEPGMLQ